MSQFGDGTWQAYITERGGSPVLIDAQLSSGSVSNAVNGSGSGSIEVAATGEPGSMNCEVLGRVEPWRHELLLTRDNDVAFVGPVSNVQVSQAGGKIDANDLFSWFDVRFLEEPFHASGDISTVFKALFDVALALEPSINLSLSTRATGVYAERDLLGDEFQRAGDVMRELARTGLDFTMVGRTLLAGGAEVFETTTPLILHDEGVLGAEVTRTGADFATDVAVIGTNEELGGIPFIGRAQRSTSVYGLVQRSYTELTIADTTSADANALSRLESMQPVPLRVKATLSREAAFEFSDLIPGRRVQVYLDRAAGCIEVMQEMRVQQVDISFGASEEVAVDLVPLGVSDAA